MIRTKQFRTLAALAAVAAVVALGAAVVRPPSPLGAAGPAGTAKTAVAAQGQDDRREGERAIRRASAAYLEALNKGDRDALVAFWAPEADYVDDAGKVTRGRDAIAELFKKSLPGLKGTRVTGKITALKFPRAEVALEDGVMEYASPDGAKETNRYVVVWTRSGDRWLIASVRDMPAEVGDVPSLTYPRLQPLEWLVGEWEAEGKEGVRLVCRWAPNKSFLLMEYAARREAGEPLEVVQRVGWDARNALLRSWVFDSEGGFGEGYWRRDGNQWVVGTAGILPDGGSGGGTNVYQFVDDKTFVWRSVDREVDGQPVADAEVKFVRKGGRRTGP